MKCHVVLNATKDKYSWTGERKCAGREDIFSDKVLERVSGSTVDRRNRCSQGVGHIAAWGKAVPGGGTANARIVLHGFKGQEQS